MKQMTLFLALLASLLAGCKQPSEIELTSDLQLETVVDVNATLERPSVDSTALLPQEHDAFAGQVLLNSVTTKSFRGIERTAFSRVVFERRDSSILGSDSTRKGFKSLRLGQVRLDGSQMTERIRFVSGMPAGFDYVKDLGATYSARRYFTLQIISPLNVGTFEASIESPDNMEVISPLGGTAISRNDDLELKWTGRGTVGLILSAMRLSDPNRPVIKPMFSGVINKESGRVKLSRKILKALPVADAYVFTFVRLNREEKTAGRFEGRILVQATSIYNSIVVLR